MSTKAQVQILTRTSTSYVIERESFYLLNLMLSYKNTYDNVSSELSMELIYNVHKMPCIVANLEKASTGHFGAL